MLPASVTVRMLPRCPSILIKTNSSKIGHFGSLVAAFSGGNLNPLYAVFRGFRHVYFLLGVRFLRGIYSGLLPTWETCCNTVRMRPILARADVKVVEDLLGQLVELQGSCSAGWNVTTIVLEHELPCVAVKANSEPGFPKAVCPPPGHNYLQKN